MTRSAVWHPFTQHALEPPMRRIVETDGAYLIDEDGNRILDAISSWWVITHGHRHSAIVKAIATAADQYDQMIFAEYTHAPAEELAEALLRWRRLALNMSSTPTAVRPLSRSH
jgi:adenosylmethionine-8-amino-7-oxononanoate aminotransferase